MRTGTSTTPCMCWGQGNAVCCGLLQLCGEDRPLPERQLRIPLPIALALQEITSSWPGVTPIALSQYPIPLGQTADLRAAALAKRLCIPGCAAQALVIRSGDALEARAAAALVSSRSAMRAILVQTDQVMGMAAWLHLNRLLPVFAQWLTPGERKTVPSIPGFSGPVIVLTGPEGGMESDDRAILDWRLETPSGSERSELWRLAATGDPDLASGLFGRRSSPLRWPDCHPGSQSP